MGSRSLAAALLVLLAAGAVARADPPAGPDSPLLRLADPSTSRQEVLTALRGAKHPDEAAVAMLERMVAEDEAHKQPAQPLADLPDDERLKELIWRLRDVRGGGGGNGGPPGLFGFSGSKPTLCDRIAALGHKAVPSLLARLDDERYTRALWYGRNPRHVGVVRIGHVAEEIVERIADRPLLSKNECRTWWKEVQAKGEFLATADEMDRSAGPRMYFAAYCGARLLRINAEAAAPLVVRACRRQQDILVRKGLLDLLTSAKGEGVEPFLRTEMASGPTLLHRVTAAVALRHRKVVDTTPDLVRMWRELKDHGRPFPSTHAQWCLDGGIASLAVALVSSGAQGVRALVEGVEKRPARTRGLVAQALGQDDVAYHLYGYLGALRIRPEPLAPAADAEKALRSLLGDLAPIDYHYTPRYRADARVVDLAARSLARRFPKRYAFALTAPVAARDKAIAAMRR